VAGADLPAEALRRMKDKYFVRGADLEPRVYLRLADSWLELTVRFLTDVYGVRDVQDRIAREVLADLDAAGIGLASAIFDIVGLPPLRLARGEGPAPAG
jgi:small-conductance mechanosensitive channel